MKSSESPPLNGEILFSRPGVNKPMTDRPESFSASDESMTEQAETRFRTIDRMDAYPDVARAQYLAESSELSSQQRGAWGERMVVKEAADSGHEILIDHSGVPTKAGFDCASYDINSRTLHIWEVKNWSDSNTIGEKDLGAWHDSGSDGMPREAYRESWETVISNASDGNLSNLAKQAINEGRVMFHLRLGPETKVAGGLTTKLEGTKVPGAIYDWKRYAMEEMLTVAPSVRHS